MIKKHILILSLQLYLNNHLCLDARLVIYDTQKNRNPASDSECVNISSDTDSQKNCYKNFSTVKKAFFRGKKSVDLAGLNLLNNALNLLFIPLRIVNILQVMPENARAGL